MNSVGVPILLFKCIYIYYNLIYNHYISSVNRFKYLIAINRINAIVNWQLFSHFYPILNVPSFLFIPLFFANCNALINMKKWIGLLCANVFLLRTTLAYTVVYNFKHSQLERHSHAHFTLISHTM